jgi:hypothetical protein
LHRIISVSEIFNHTEDLGGEQRMNNVVKQIPSLIEKLNSLSGEYAELKELFFDDYSIELAEDSIKVLKLLNSGRKYLEMIKFKHFIKGLNLDTDEENIQKLIDYIDNSEKAEFVINVFDKILMSNSKLACCTIGLLLNDLCITKKNISQHDLVILQALAMMNDFDITNFTHLMSTITWDKKAKYKIINSQNKKTCYNKYGDSYECLDLTIKLLEKYGLVDADGEIDLSVDTDNVDLSSADYDKYFQFNLLSKRLYSYTQKIVQ